MTQEDMASQYERLAKSKVEGRISINSTEVNFAEEECKQITRGTEDHSYSPARSHMKHFRTTASANSEERSRRLLDYSISIEEQEKVNNFLYFQLDFDYLASRLGAKFIWKGTPRGIPEPETSSASTERIAG